MTAVLDCGHVPSAHDPRITTGYGTDKDGRTACYECCAENDKKAMIAEGKAQLYWDAQKSVVTNWPGSLRFTVYHFRWGKHNMAGKRVDGWFVGPEGKVWHFKNMGFSDIAHCRRTKQK